MSPAATALTGRDQPCPEPRRPAPDRPRCTRFLDLSALLTAPMCARAWTREILREWQLDGVADVAEMIVSEVAANAVVHAPGGPGQSVIRLALAFDNGELAILVGDSNPGSPVVTHPDEDAETGRGLSMVEFVSAMWGVHLLGDGTGKVVWALLAAVPGAQVHAVPTAAAREMMARPAAVFVHSAGPQAPPQPGEHQEDLAGVQASRPQRARP